LSCNHGGFLKALVLVDSELSNQRLLSRCECECNKQFNHECSDWRSLDFSIPFSIKCTFGIAVIVTDEWQLDSRPYGVAIRIATLCALCVTDCSSDCTSDERQRDIGPYERDNRPYGVALCGSLQLAKFITNRGSFTLLFSNTRSVHHDLGTPHQSQATPAREFHAELYLSDQILCDGDEPLSVIGVLCGQNSFQLHFQLSIILCRGRNGRLLLL